jgi:hypothetical protein
MKKWSAPIVAVMCLCFLGCDNGTGTSGNGTPFTGPTSIEEVIEYLADKKQDGSDPDNPVELAVRISGSEWEQLFDAIIQADKFVALDLSRCYNVPQEFSFTAEFDYTLANAANDKIVSLSLPAGIESIGPGAFFHCTNLERVDLPARLTKINHSAFSYCTSLMQIDLPASLAGIGGAAFYGCTGMEQVICRAATPPAILPLQPAVPEGSENLFYNTSPNLDIKVPAKSVAAYKAAWPVWADRIGPM